MSHANRTFTSKSGLRNDQKAICRIFDRAALYGAGHRHGEPSDSCRRGGSRSDPLRLALQLQQMPRENRLKLGLPAITPMMGGLPDMEGAGQGKTIYVAGSGHADLPSSLPWKKPSASACVRQVSLPLKRPSSRGRAMPSRVMSRDAENAAADTRRSMPQPVRVKVFPAGMTNRYDMWVAAESRCKQHVVNSEQRCGFYPGVFGKRRSTRLPDV